MTKIPPKGPPPPPPRGVARRPRPQERPKTERLEDEREDKAEAMSPGLEKTAAIDTEEELKHAGEKAQEAWDQLSADPDEAEERKLVQDRQQDEKERAKAVIQAREQTGKATGKDSTSQQSQGKPQGESELRDGFEAERAKAAAGKGQLDGTASDPLAAAKAAEATAQLRPRRPDDAMTVLHNAKEPGYFFTEERDGGGQAAAPQEQELSEEQKELLAAVEEARRQLAEVKGILRISAGKNENNEPVVVIVATRGFGEASMRRVPPKVHRFATLLALPYDLLPLRRERL